MCHARFLLILGVVNICVLCCADSPFSRGKIIYASRETILFGILIYINLDFPTIPNLVSVQCEEKKVIKGLRNLWQLRVKSVTKWVATVISILGNGGKTLPHDIVQFFYVDEGYLLWIMAQIGRKLFQEPIFGIKFLTGCILSLLKFPFLRRIIQSLKVPINNRCVTPFCSWEINDFLRNINYQFSTLSSPESKLKRTHLPNKTLSQ